MSWQDLNQIISNIQKKGGLKKKFQNSVLKDFLEKKYGVENFTWRGSKIEIKAGSTLLAQELFLRREVIKEELNKVLENDAKEKRDNNFPEIKEIIIRTGRANN